MAEVKDQIVGSVGICPVDFMAKYAKNGGLKPKNGETNAVMLRSMAVDTKYCGKGIGSALMKHVIYYCYESDFEEIVLGTNLKLVEAVGLYHKFGFQDVSFEPVLEVYMKLDVKEAKQRLEKCQNMDTKAK